MQISTLIFCLVLGFVYSKPEAGGRIIGGQLARAGQFPYVTGLYVDTGSDQHFCGGSLLNRTWILTAAHCLYNAKSIRIRLATNTLVPPDNVVNVGSNATSSFTVIHPDFNPTTLENDIGLLRMNLPISYGEWLHPITLAPEGEANAGTIATIAGWGQLSDTNGGISNDLYYVQVAVISNEECKLTYGDQIKDTMVCTQGNGNEGICIGDTGGPLISVDNDLHEELLIGVAGFFSQAGCETVHPSGYVRIEPYLDWIQSTIQT